MDRFKRITVKDVKKAYKDTGLKPTTMFMYDAQDHSACALGALLLAGGYAGDVGKATIGEAAKTLNLPEDYVGGFALGFDASPGEPIFTDFPDVDIFGIRDGRKVGKSIFPKYRSWGRLPHLRLCPPHD